EQFERLLNHQIPRTKTGVELAFPDVNGGEPSTVRDFGSQGGQLVVWVFGVVAFYPRRQVGEVVLASEHLGGELPPARRRAERARDASNVDVDSRVVEIDVRLCQLGNCPQDGPEGRLID